MNRNKSHLRRKFSLVNLTAIVLCMSLFTYLQFEFMDDIFLFAEKKALKYVAQEISELDPHDKSFRTSCYHDRFV